MRGSVGPFNLEGWVAFERNSHGAVIPDGQTQQTGFRNFPQKSPSIRPDSFVHYVLCNLTDTYCYRAHLDMQLCDPGRAANGKSRGMKG